MRKSLILTLAIAFVLGVAATAFAAANPFSDVPANSWAYKAVAQLTKDGIIDGYPDGTFKGDKSMTRYEMAQIVYRAIQREDKANAEQKALIDKLSAEFANELNNLGVKVDKLSDQVNNRIYLTGKVTLRYDNYSGEYKGKDIPFNKNGQKLFRTELYVNGKVNDSWKYFASIRNDKTFGAVNSVQNAASISTTSAGGNNYTQFRQAYVSGNLMGITATVGRQPNTPAYGLVVDEDMTGLKLAGGGDVVTWEGFWGTTEGYSFTAAQIAQLQSGNLQVPSQAPVTWWDLAVAAKLSDTLRVKAAYMNPMMADGSTFNGFMVGWKNLTQMKFAEAGFDWKFAPGWKFTGVYSQASNGGQNEAMRFQVDYGKSDVNVPGTWHSWVAYTDAEAQSIWDSTYEDLPGYNDTTGNSGIPAVLGAKGWEIGFDYVWAKNIQMKAFYNYYDATVNWAPNTNLSHFRTDFYFYF